MGEKPWATGTGPGVTRAGILCVVGARPNFMKMAPILRALEDSGDGLSVTLVHTGQHYGTDMQDAFFTQLGMPVPDIDLGVGSGTHAAQTAEIMSRFEPVLDSARPRAVVVVGDVNSTLACALVAVKKGIPVAHVEAGLRSRDRSMPEEINRLLTDQISDLHFITERGARDNLRAEGIADENIHFVGNVMIDTLRHHQQYAVPTARTLRHYGVSEADAIVESGYALVTMHRPSNVDDPAVLGDLLGTLERVSERLPVVFPVHPRTRRALEALRMPEARMHPIALLPAVGYLEALGLMSGARVVLTDSGGMQEETTALGIPCLTLRDNTERPITIDEGTNILTGNDRERILESLDNTLETGGRAGRIPELWDGHAGDRIADVLRRRYAGEALRNRSAAN
ncbi:MAG: non-hydrolyzing UDP-N-acetylglucosamine 2-epimerase [Halofilum sp. (in: g-proteobacteria)]